MFNNRRDVSTGGVMYKKKNKFITFSRSPTPSHKYRAQRETNGSRIRFFLVSHNIGRGIRTAAFPNRNICERVSSNKQYVSSQYVATPTSPDSPLHNTPGMTRAPLPSGDLTAPFPPNPRLQLQRCFLSTPHHKRDVLPPSLPLSPHPSENGGIRSKLQPNRLRKYSWFASLSKRASPTGVTLLLYGGKPRSSVSS